MDFSERVLAQWHIPLLMSALEEGGKKDLREKAGVEGKGKGRREGGRGEPVAHDHQIASSYSTSPVPLHRWAGVKRGSSSS